MNSKSPQNYRPETIAITAGRPDVGPDSLLNQPISLNSTFVAGGAIGYGRYGNETWTALEVAIAALEGAKTLTYSSGMAAVTAVFSTLPVGAKVVASNQGYSGVMTLLGNLSAAKKLNPKFVSIADTAEVVAALDGADLLWIESPTNPSLDVADMPTLIKEAKSRGITVAVDNTFATALTQQPILMGADIVMNSVTKYLAGHSDVVLGSLSTNNSDLFKAIEDARKFNGSIPGPFEAWLALRGIRTFPLRFQRASENALEIAKRLSAHPLVTRVRYPGLPTDPQHAKAKAFMKGFGAIVSFEYDGDAAATDKVCESSKIVTYATSLGGVESLWERRRRWPIESASVPEALIRLSLGCEDVDDLWSDIDAALHAAKK
ncbi:cystathionine gamma-synthase [Actinobacteria bacterium IMCC26103]|nr:cystathionine gamma-synthase [Actinobacteria bacterium IMCC26103]